MAHAKTMSEKLADTAPYNIFYNKIPDLSDTQDSSTVNFTDFLCPSLGNLKCSLHIVSKVDIEWLIKQYEIMHVETKPLTVLYGQIEGKPIEKSHFPNVSLQCLSNDETTKKNYGYSSHHEKISIYVYEDNSLRIVISTCNLRSQWELFNHGFWMSPACPPLSGDSSGDSTGESSTNFKSDLLKLFNHYELPILDTWINYITNADFSDVKVFLVTSIPGRYQAGDFGSHIQQVENILKKHCRLPREENSWPVIAQASNLGQFGDSPNVWLRSFFLNHLAPPRTELKIVFPTWKQVKNGRYDPDVVGEGIRYSRQVHNNQKWIQDYLYQWKANTLGRSKILPHMKTYCRVSPCCSKMAWFLITTGNINKSAWGGQYHTKYGVKTDEIFVRNCEVGVMLLPKFFSEEYFRVQDDVGVKVFPLIYDLPLIQYTERDHPWTLLKSKIRAH